MNSNTLHEIKQNSDVAIYTAGRQGNALKKLIESFRKDLNFKFYIDDFKKGWNIKSPDQLSTNEKSQLYILFPGSISSPNNLATHLEVSVNHLFSISPGFDINQTFLDIEIEKNADKIKYIKELFCIAEDKKKFLEIIQCRRYGSLQKYKKYPMQQKQYFDYIPIKSVKTIIDGGIDTDTEIQSFYEKFPSLSTYIGFEPNPKSKIWQKNLNYSGCTIEKLGLWNCTENAWLQDCGSSSFIASEKHLDLDSHMVKLVSLDSYLEKANVPKIDLIKLDVEGAEMNVIKGAIKTILKNRPIMAISIYHSKFDLLDIPLFLSENLDNYDFRIGHYTEKIHETILYLIPKERMP